MISRKYLIISLLMIFLFCFNIVSASDINETVYDGDDLSYQDGIYYDIVNDEVLYEQPATDNIFNKSNSECCSFVIQEQDETVYAFRQDSPLNGNGVEINVETWNGLNIIKQQIDAKERYFFHSIITENGWVIGQGGSQYNSASRSIEQIAGQIVLSNDISPNYLNQVKNILAGYRYGHFFIKAPDGRYGISFANTYLTGTLNVGQYMVIPNEYKYHVKGNYKSYSSNPVDAIIIACSYDASGENRRNLMTYDYKVHDTANGQYYAVDVYATNDNGHNVGLDTSRIVTHFYYKGKYYPPSVVPENPGKYYVGTHIFENQPVGNVIHVINGEKSVLVNNDVGVEFRFEHITTAKTITFDLEANMDFVGAVLSHGSYTYNAKEHRVYWNVPAVFEAKHIIITTRPKAVSYYDILCRIQGMSESSIFEYYAAEYGAKMIVNNVDKYRGGPQGLEVYLNDKVNNPLVGEKVVIEINGKKYNREIKDIGCVFLALNLDPGEYKVKVAYAGKFGNLKDTANVTIRTTLSGKDIEKYYKNATQFYASFLDGNGNPLRNSDVQFNINGVFYTRKTDGNGVSKLNINLEPKKYIITSINLATGEKCSNSITVKKVLVENRDVVKYYRNDTQYSVKVLDGHGKALKCAKVQFNINGVLYYRTSDENGTAKMNINLNPGNYIITATYNGGSVSNKINVLTRLVSSDLSMKYNDSSKFKVSVLDENGKVSSGENITFNINGVFYNRITDDNGVATLGINLMAGKYIITSQWNDYKQSNTITIS